MSAPRNQTAPMTLAAGAAVGLVGIIIGYFASQVSPCKTLLKWKSSASAAPAAAATATTAMTGAASIEHDKPVETRMYEQAKALNEYLLLHYGEAFSGNFAPNADGTSYSLDFGTELTNEFGNFGLFDVKTGKVNAPLFPTFALNFPARVAQLAAHFAGVATSAAPAGRALDVGCAVGRTTFELSNFFDTVIGIDYSNSFIEAAKLFGTGAICPVTVPIEGGLNFKSTVSIAGRFRPAACSFQVGDAGNMDVAALGKFSCVTAANLIDRLPRPRAFLKACAHLVAPGGVLVITSPYTWLAEFTPREEWLGGGYPTVSADGTEKFTTTFEALKTELLGDFELVHHSHMPFFIRETGRKNQFTLAHATVWRRK